MQNFLAINKDYFGLGLKSIDIMLISQIEEFKRNNCSCYLTNEQFSNMFGESQSTIKRALDKLESLGIISRETSFVGGNGRANRQRVLSVNKRTKWKVQNEPTNRQMEGSNVDDGRFKSEQWKVHNEPIKDNLKDNKKENLSKRKLEELKEEELLNLLEDFRKKIRYVELQEKYGLRCGETNKELANRIEHILEDRKKGKPILLSNGEYSEYYFTGTLFANGLPPSEELDEYIDWFAEDDTYGFDRQFMKDWFEEVKRERGE